MEMAQAIKLDWIPLYIHRLKASKRWAQMQDFERGWYMTLIIEAADSAMPGYLPNNDAVLWRLAGAKTKAYFQREGQSVLQCFDGRTDDGVWIYNRPLLTVIQEQLQRLQNKGSRKKEISISLSSSFSPSIYQDYPRKVNRVYSIAAISKAIRRVMKEKSIEEVDAAQFIHKAVIEFRDSPAGHAIDQKTGESVVPHCSTWMNKSRWEDDRSEWGIEQKPALLAKPYIPPTFDSMNDSDKMALARVTVRENGRVTDKLKPYVDRILAEKKKA